MIDFPTFRLLFNLYDFATCPTRGTRQMSRKLKCMLKNDTLVYVLVHRMDVVLPSPLALVVPLELRAS